MSHKWSCIYTVKIVVVLLTGFSARFTIASLPALSSSVHSHLCFLHEVAAELVELSRVCLEFLHK